MLDFGILEINFRKNTNKFCDFEAPHEHKIKCTFFLLLLSQKSIKVALTKNPSILNRWTTTKFDFSGKEEENKYNSRYAAF